MEKIESMLPPELLQVAYKTKNGELAWPKEHALRVVDIINANGHEVSKVEPWLPTNPGPIPLILNWRASRHAHSDKMPNTPEQFIQQFETLHPLQEGQVPVFNFSVKKASV